MTIPSLLACLAAALGYMLWQRERYGRTLPAREAAARALADAAAFAVILAGVWLGGSVVADWGVPQISGMPGATIGVTIGMLLAGPLRRALLARLGIDPGRLM